MLAHELIEYKRLAIQHQLDAARTQAERNKLGQFATPSELAMDMLEYAKSLLPDNQSVRFLDPAVGTGSFLSALLRAFPQSRIASITGYEIDPYYGHKAMELWDESLFDVRIADFTRVTLDQSYNVVMYDIDMFDNDANVVNSLHAAGRVAIYYIDAGTWENWRPDANQFPNSVKGKPVSGWPGERWLDIRQLSILEPIMTTRVQLCQSKGFDGVEFDNVDGYTNTTGFPLTYNQQLTYDSWLANEAHTMGLSVALKNDLDQVSDLLPYFDWALDEQCFQYQECAKLQPFIQSGKAVMEVEYNLNPAKFCPEANALNFNSLKKHLNLGTYRVACR